jgi:DNA-binding NarL/FixJ family response regulator
MAKPRLLLADDHPLVLEGLRRVLESEFEIAGAATNGRELVAMALEKRPDAVILDVGMPDLNGIEAARQIRAVLPAVKIVFVTQMEERAYVRAAFNSGASAYLLKQSVVAELPTGVKEALGGRFYVSQSLRGGETEALLGGDTNPSSLFGHPLTPRQREVLQLIAEGKTGKEIGVALSISTRTVEFHKNAIMNELGLRTTAELTRYAIVHGIVPSGLPR